MSNQGEEIGFNAAWSIAGLLGSIVFLSKNAAKNFKTTVFSLFSGMILANYMTPLIVKFIDGGDNLQFVIAFLIGASGKRITMLIINALEEKVKTKLYFLFSKNKKTK